MEPAEPPAGATRAARWGRLERIHVLLLLLVTCAHWAPRLCGPIDLRYDGGVYYVLGTSLAQGKGYRLLNEPGEIQAIQYPPLLPAAVALHQLVLGTDDPLVVGQALRVSSLLVSLVYALAVYALARRLTSARPALLAALLASVYFQTLYMEDLLFTEVPYAVLTVGFFLALGSERARLRACAPLLAAATFFLRTAGVALLAAWALDALRLRQWRALALRGALGLACVLAWQGYVSAVRNGPEYQHPAYAYQRAPYQYYNVSYAENVALLDPFKPEAGLVTPGALARRLADSFGPMVIGLGESVSSSRGFWQWPLWLVAERFGLQEPFFPTVPILITVLVSTLGAGVLVGLALLARRGQVLLLLYVLCSLGLIALLPWPGQVSRYLVPLTPFLTLALAVFLAELVRWARTPAGVACGLVLCAQAFAVRQMFAAYHWSVRYPKGPEASRQGSIFLFEDKDEWRAFYAALGWLAENTDPGAVVASSCPHLVWLHSGRKAVLPPFEPETEEAQRLLDAVPVEYVVVDELSFLDVSRRYAAPVVGAHPEAWAPVFRASNGFLTIYRRRH